MDNVTRKAFPILLIYLAVPVHMCTSARVKIDVSTKSFIDSRVVNIDLFATQPSTPSVTTPKSGVYVAPSSCQQSGCVGYEGKVNVEVVGKSLSKASSKDVCHFRTSATAELNLPIGSTVIQAFLYWSASGIGPQSSRVKFNDKLVVSDAIYHMALGSRHYYGARADVTRFVSAPGRYKVSGINVDKEGYCELFAESAYGAWSLIVVFETTTLVHSRLNICFNPMIVDFNGVAEDGCVATVRKNDQVALLRFVAFEGDPEFDDSELFINEQSVGSNLFEGSIAPSLDIGAIDISHVVARGSNTLQFEIVNARDSVLIPIRILHQTL